MAMLNARMRGRPDLSRARGGMTLKLPPWLSRDWLLGLLLVLAALGAYANSFSGPFLYDDLSAIQSNLSILHLWPPWVPLLPPGNLTVGGRPILNLSFALNYAMSGFNVWSYHAFNLLVHILAGLTLLGVVRRTLLQPVLREKFGADSLLLAPAIALLWTLHPLQTEAVTYISQRAESLMGFFYLLTLYAFIRTVASAPDRRGWPVICVTACFLGMATKEVMVTAPLMALLYDRTFVAGSFREAWRQHWLLYLALAASWVVPAYSFLDVGKTSDIGFGSGVTPWTYALTECGALLHYLKLVFWPHPLVFDYGPEMAGDPWEVLPQALILAVLLTITAIALMRRPEVGFAGVWFFLILAPTSSVIPVALSPMGEHRLYLPLAAPVVLLVLSLYAWMGRLSLVLAAALIIACTVLTFERNEDYRSEFALWQQVVDLRPGNSRAHNNLGKALLQKGELDEALAEFQKALEINPNYAEAHCNLGNALLQKGWIDEAMSQFQKALQINPNFAETHNDLSMVLLQKGQVDEAASECQKALEINPNAAEAHCNLGNVFLHKGQMDEAAAEYQKALEINPNVAEAQNNLGNILLKQGQVDEAIAQYQKALEINPNDADIHTNLGIAYAQKGEVDEAVAQFQDAVQINPDNRNAQYHLAKTQAMARQVPGSK